MAMTGSTCNPYQPPNVTLVDVVLAPDTKFLFHDKVVAGVGWIVLPQICVVTGTTDHLVAHESRLWRCSRWITNGSVITALAAAFVGISMLTHLPPGSKGLAPWAGIESSLQLMVRAALWAAAVGFLAAGFLFRSAVDVRGFISDQIANTSFSRRL